MRIDILTLFPKMCEAFVGESIIGRARERGAVKIVLHDIRDYTQDKHRRVDDYPYGGGSGMIMQAQPIGSLITALKANAPQAHTVYLSPKGAVFDQKKAIELSRKENLILLCGHYEGVDQRAIDAFCDEEISVGDYVLTGGELPALIVTDAVSRLLPGVLKSEESFKDESIYSGLLEYPQYTRPENYNGMRVPEVLLSGDHAQVDRWRRNQSLTITAARRPDLLEKAQLSEQDLAFLRDNEG